MQKLKFNHRASKDLSSKVENTTWRLFDDKNLRVGDRFEAVDKVLAADPKSWEIIGQAEIDSIIEKRLKAISDQDFKEQRQITKRSEMLNYLKDYYGDNVDLEVPIKIIKFRFSPYGQKKQFKEGPGLSKDESLFKIFTDGGSRGNPGPSASGFVILDSEDQVLLQKGVYLGIATNNKAEYTALKLSLEEAHKMGARKLEIYMDSLLIVNQMKGAYKIKSADLLPIYENIKQLLTEFDSHSFTHVPRAYNKLADREVNKALDKALNR